MTELWSDKWPGIEWMEVWLAKERVAIGMSWISGRRFGSEGH